MMWNKDRFQGIIRQMSNTKPVMFATDKDFDDTEDQYRLSRDTVLILLKQIEELKSYEHGGSTYKALLEGIAKVKGQVKGTKEDLSDNMYKVNAKVFQAIEEKSRNKEIASIAAQIKDDNLAMCEHKHKMNLILDEILKDAKDLKKQSLVLDNERTKMKNAQYYAEKKFEAHKKKMTEKEALEQKDVDEKKKEFEKYRKGCFEEMNKFLKDPRHLKIIKEILDTNRNYIKEAAEKIKECQKNKK